MFKTRVLCLASALLLTMGLAAAEKNEFTPQANDWPEWQGPDRTAISRETGLLQTWPKEGLTRVWKADGLGGGYSGPSVAAGRVFAMSYRGNDEGVWALEESTGKELWFTPLASRAQNIGH